MWAGIYGDYFVGLHVLPHRHTENHYRDLLLHDPPKLQEDVPLAVRARMWHMHDGAPAQFSGAVRDVLCNTYHDDGQRERRIHYMVSVLARLESSGFLPVGTT
jgi:hypothetical protein